MDALSSCAPQANSQPEPPMAQAPKPTGVMNRSEFPSCFVFIGPSVLVFMIFFFLCARAVPTSQELLCRVSKAGKLYSRNTVIALSRGVCCPLVQHRHCTLGQADVMQRWLEAPSFSARAAPIRRCAG